MRKNKLGEVSLKAGAFHINELNFTHDKVSNLIFFFVIFRLLKLAGADCYMMRREGIGYTSSQPHIHITRASTREVKVQPVL